jgi:hypothetical protein
MTTDSQAPSLDFLKWISLGFAAITLAITLVFFGWWSMREQFVFDDQPFEQTRWMAQASAKTPPCDRGDMVRDLQKRLLKRGMSKSQATILLGRPNWEEGNQFEYELGVCLWVVHGLRLYFDDQGLLTHTSIIQH